MTVLSGQLLGINGKLDKSCFKMQNLRCEGLRMFEGLWKCFKTCNASYEGLRTEGFREPKSDLRCINASYKGLRTRRLKC